MKLPIGAGNQGDVAVVDSGKLTLSRTAGLTHQVQFQHYCNSDTWVHALSTSHYDISATFTPTSQTAVFVPIYIPILMQIAAIDWFQLTQGNYTASNENSVALYSYARPSSGEGTGVLTRVATSGDKGSAIFSQAANAEVNQILSTSYVASPGVYYIGLLYSASASVAVPTFGARNLQNAGISVMDLTNNARISGQLASQTTLASSYNASQFSGLANVPFFGVDSQPA